jgi:hypothetical protein
MAHTGEWEQAGIRIIPVGARYRVAVQSILDVLGQGPSDTEADGNQAEPRPAPPPEAGNGAAGQPSSGRAAGISQ